MSDTATESATVYYHPVPPQLPKSLMPFDRFPSRPGLLFVAACWPTLAFAQSPGSASLENCAAIGAASDRLACYDKLAGRAPAPTEPLSKQSAPGAFPAPPAPLASSSRLAPTGAPPTDASSPPQDTSLLSRYWELAPSDKRGTFNLLGYQPNYVLPVHLTDHINRSPQSPTHPAVAEPDYRREEAKYQVSLRTKLAQDLPIVGGDFWVAFTQQAFWQVYTASDSKPFRNTDYQPEAMYVLATSPSLRALPFGWQWRYTQLALAHQSNGQSDPLSRSWNRTYLGAGFERGDWSLIAKINKRFKEPVATDDNPDLVHYRGRADIQLNWAHELQTVSLQVRTNFNTGSEGSAQLEWTYPIFRDRPNGLRWYVQGFTGYGETLTDYNFKQTSVGVGVTFLQF